jgi:hypothetical protein
MKAKGTVILFFFIATAVRAAFPAENEPSPPLGWVYLQSGAQYLRSKPARRKPGSVYLGQGTLAPVLNLESKEGSEWARVRVVDLATLTPQVGWVPVKDGSMLPPERFPSDSSLLRLMGGEYLDDFTSSQTDIARFLISQATSPPLLLCYVVSSTLASGRLVVFKADEGNFTPGPSIQFSLADMKAGILTLEVRDLIGDGNECIVTHETFRDGPETRGVNMVIRRVTTGELRTLWQAPLEYRNLTLYPPQLQILTPAEKNIGGAGSVTTGEVTFRQRGKAWEPVWRGKVEFYQVGREQALDSVNIEKTCFWNGTVFAPLR